MEIFTQTLTIKEAITFGLVLLTFFEFGILYGICKFNKRSKR